MLLLQNAMTYWYPVDIAHILLCGKNLRFLYFFCKVFLIRKKKEKGKNNLRIIGICYYSLKEIYAGSFIIPLSQMCTCMQSSMKKIFLFNFFVTFEVHEFACGTKNPFFRLPYQYLVHSIV